MNYPEALISWMGACLLLSGFLTVIFRRFGNILKCYIAQAVFLVVATLAVGYKTGNHHLYFMAVVTFLIKGVGIPAWIRTFLSKISSRSEERLMVSVSVSLVCAAGLLLLSHSIASAAMQGHADKIDDLTVSLTLLLLGLFLMMTRRKAFTQMMAILFMENAVTAAGIFISGGMSFVVELGILLDVLMGILVMGLLVFQIQTAFYSIDTEEMNLLQG